MAATNAQFGELVTKASTDKSLRDVLISNPRRAAEGLGITLSEADIADLEKIFEGLKRFWNNQDDDAAEASSWSVGILNSVRNCPVGIRRCPMADSDTLITKPDR